MTKAVVPLDRQRVSADDYRAFYRSGFLIVRGLLSEAEIDELRRHTDELMQGRLPEQQAREGTNRSNGPRAMVADDLGAPPDHLLPQEKAQYFLRIHMLHRRLELHERTLLHPRVLDVMEVLIGPDVLALQSMLFLKPAGSDGQGWHQDSYYIPTHPDTLCGAWIAIDDCDERNGAMWFAKGSGVEPIYPPCPGGYGFGNTLIGDVRYVRGTSNTDDAKNHLSPVADRYDQVLASMTAGDVAFFDGHVLHRSKANWTADRFRRSFVGHYCNARSFTQWGPDAPSAWCPTPVDDRTGAANGSHILARGDTHLPFAKPRFGTPCSALLSREARAAEGEYAARVIAEHANGLLGCGTATPVDDHD